MEDDSKSDANCKDIALQLIENEPGKSLNVIMGGGLRSFISDWEPQGRRKDDRNLTAEWLNDHPNGVFVTDRWQMLNVSSRTENVLGIFAQSHMHFNADRDRETEPSLAEMTETAIKILKRNNRNGFLLVVEGGKIDLAHHYNNAFRALDDTLAFDEAVDVALRRIGEIILMNFVLLILKHIFRFD
jgi:alkaline phosphatase